MQLPDEIVAAQDDLMKGGLGPLLATLGISQAELARRIGVSQASVSQWVSGVKRLPAEQCAAIERATKGRIKRKELRPDLFGPL